MSDDRKEAVRSYKERKIPRGVFVLLSTTTDRRWVDASPNLDAARNLLFFELKRGGHRNRDLQTEWNTHGESSFEFEVVEELDAAIVESAVRDELKSKRSEWVTKLGVTTVSP